jgi:hypothetical protein
MPLVNGPKSDECRNHVDRSHWETRLSPWSSNLAAFMKTRDYGSRGSAALTTRHPSMSKTSALTSTDKRRSLGWHISIAGLRPRSWVLSYETSRNSAVITKVSLELIPRKMNPIHTFTFHFLKFYFNITLPSVREPMKPMTFLRISHFPMHSIYPSKSPCLMGIIHADIHTCL